MSLKHRTYQALETSTTSSPLIRAFHAVIMLLIALNVLAVILETVASLAVPYHLYFKVFEIISVVIFTIEYGLRLWSCTTDPNYRHPIMGRLKFAIKPLNLIDLITILPFYVPFYLTMDTRFVRALRLVRLARVFKFGRYSEAFRTFANVLNSKKEELFTTMFITVIMLIVSSSLMYFVEHEAQPDKFSSIPAAMWWGVSALTTVGYGDVYPITPLGRFLGMIVALLGIGIFALPPGILGAGFIDEIQRNRGEQVQYCPHCGLLVHEKEMENER